MVGRHRHPDNRADPHHPAIVTTTITETVRVATFTGIRLKIRSRSGARSGDHTQKFLNNTFGVTGKPFMRPPYGARNSNVDSVAANLGYTSIMLIRLTPLHGGRPRALRPGSFRRWWAPVAPRGRALSGMRPW